MFDQKTIDWYTRKGVTPPEHISHSLTDEEISSRMERLEPTNWRMEGNKLIADTDFGPLVNYLPTDLIMTGIDDKGLPILTRIKV